MFESFLEGIMLAMSVKGILALVVGSTIGFIFGSIPGLTGGMAMALLIPYTWGMSPNLSILLLAGTLGASSQGGSTPAILVNIPGVPSQVVVTMDGHPMTRRGEGARALGLAASSAGFGAIFGIVTLVVTLPFALKLIRSVAAPEFFWLILFALVGLYHQYYPYYDIDHPENGHQDQPYQRNKRKYNTQYK